MNDQKKFNKPLDQWVEENKEIEATVPTLTKGKVEYVKKKIKATERVMYTEPSIYSDFCAKKDHYWEVEDKHNYIFRCKKCRMKRRVYPLTYDFKDGKLIHRKSGEPA